MNRNQWYGYRHVNGTLHVKRYFSHKDIVEARSSDFVDEIFGPWSVNSRNEAVQKLKDEVKNED